MERLLPAYTELLEAYTREVRQLEVRGEEAGASWRPHKALNSRLFIFDEHLTNSHHGGFCYAEKQAIMPALVRFIALYEKSSDKQRKVFEDRKPQSDYQQFLDELLADKFPFTDYLEARLRETHYQEERCKMPLAPRRSNATRQQAVFRQELAEYEGKMASIRACRQEARERIQLYKELLGN